MKRSEFGKEPEDAAESKMATAGTSARPAQPAAKAEILTEHTVTADETLSHIALKYYGSAVREKWMVIYEANKEIIGSDPGIIRPGMVLKIPKLGA